MTEQRYCISCDYDLRGLGAGKCPECGRAFDPAVENTYRKIVRGEIERKTLDNLRPTTITFLAIAATALVGSSAWAVDPFVMWMLTGAASVLIVPLVAVWILVECLARDPQPRLYLAAVVLAAACVTTLWWQWPLRLNFALHRSGFERLADQVQAGNAPPFPTRIGIFTIRGADATGYTNTVGLHFDTDTAGPAGFYRTTTPVRNPPANEWSWVRLSDLWWMIHED